MAETTITLTGPTFIGGVLRPAGACIPVEQDAFVAEDDAVARAKRDAVDAALAETARLAAAHQAEIAALVHRAEAAEADLAAARRDADAAAAERDALDATVREQAARIETLSKPAEAQRLPGLTGKSKAKLLDIAKDEGVDPGAADTVDEIVAAIEKHRAAA